MRTSFIVLPLMPHELGLLFCLFHPSKLKYSTMYTADIADILEGYNIREIFKISHLQLGNLKAL